MRIFYLENRLRKLEAAVFSRTFSVVLDTGEVVSGMEFSRLVRGIHQAVNGQHHTHDAYIALHTVSAADEFGQKQIDMYRATQTLIST